MSVTLPIPGFSGYFASDDGTIWTSKLKGGNSRESGRQREVLKQMKTTVGKRGYVRVSLDVSGRVHAVGVHHLVLLAFRGIPPKGSHGRHYPDPTKTNNRLENLLWGSPLDNSEDRTRDIIITNEKECRRCHVIKPRSDFYSDKRAWDNLQGECKVCHVQIAVSTRDQEKKRIANKEYMRRKRADKTKSE